MPWIQIWIFPPHKRSYCLGSCYAPSSCFWCNICYHIVHWFVFLCQTYAEIFYKLVCLKQENSIFQEIVQLVVVLFAAIFTVFVVVFIYFLWCYCLKKLLWTTIVMIVKNVFNRNLNCLTQLLNCFYPLFLSCTPNISWVIEHIIWYIQINEP